ncbi:uncharacterized protein LOC121713374 [Alosa sapidissima]|uniref:uncharacterized protein LOC121713374 n=1 Tax=Alosa sapidissima TaxID=34773 RepID=UPI001C0803D5|nr:uncharacterized protein LOC121713374 [Alosa sapidissima]XP_041953867.1 uncharacterized protein LOC121713374 [Alosa sapidissima]
MASPFTLCQQNQNRPQQGFPGILKTHNEQAKAPGTVKLSKPNTVHHGTKRGLENQDPSAPERSANTVNKLKGVSRLPVLAKSLQQPATTDPTQIKWEERPLLGKEKRKKACTKPQPFNLSQPRASRFRTQRQEQASVGTAGKVRTIPASHPTQTRPAKTQSCLHPKPKIGASVPSRTKPTGPGTFGGTSTHTGSLPAKTATLNGKTFDQCQNVLSRLEHGASENQASDSLSTLGCPVPESKTATQLDVLKDISKHLSGISLTSSKHATNAKDEGLSEARDYKTPFRTPHSHAAPQRVKITSQTARSTPSVCKPENTTEGFCPDPSALRSILQSEGVKAAGLQGTVPRPSGRGTSVYLPQRVSVLKSAQRQKANTGKPQAFSPDPTALGSILQNEGIQPGDPSEGATARPSACPSGRGTSVYTAQRVPISKSRTKDVSAAQGNAVTFSPDPTALGSILQNEGIQTGGATPRASGRGTSVYTAQRVPVTKSRTELIAASLGPARSSPLTPAVKWTPLRVPNTKPQSMKRLLSAYRNPKFSGSPAIRDVQPSSSEHPSNKEDGVVQRLFEEQEEEEKMEEDDEEQHALRQTGENPELEEEAEPPVTHEAEVPFPVQGPAPTEMKASHVPFLQAPNRDSVIVLCSGQRLFGQTPARGTAPLTETQALSSATQEAHGPSSLPVGTLPRALRQPSGSKVTASLENTISAKATQLCQKRVLELRRRLPILEELFLDEECATYMSQPQYCVALPRCSNPVASTLLYRDSTCFMPIGLASPSPTSCSV